MVADKCFKNKDYSFSEAENCESFHFDNDYKLSQIHSFWEDHIPRHAIEYMKCADSVQDLSSVIEKDSAF